ncbi:MAG: zinc ABC transporter substrate-binding protein [Nanoarchaeota archaeon]|nr:zinc ABC transporter substrate-binding protein [Nanoarchaeota archaeon]
MNKLIIYLVVIFTLFMTACSTPTYNTQEAEENISELSQPLILTTFYPVEEITKAIVQNTAEVKVVVGTGVEPHSFEPSPTQIVELSKADVFVIMKGMFEHIEEEILNTNPNIKIIDSSLDLELINGNEGEDDEYEEESQDSEDEFEEHDLAHGESDPHVWLSIHNMEAMTNEIFEQLIEIYPENKELYETNAQAYLDKLEELEKEFATKLSNCEHNKIIVNHKAFGYLAHEYGFEQIGIAGFSPESEPSPKTIQNVVDEAKKHKFKYIFSEGQLDKKTAQTIANDIGGEILELNPIKLNENENYFSIMRANLNNIVKGLDCQN